MAEFRGGDMNNEQIQAARRKFLGSRLWQHAENLPDDVPVDIEIVMRNGYTLSLTLGELRALRTDLEQNYAPSFLLPAPKGGKHE